MKIKWGLLAASLLLSLSALKADEKNLSVERVDFAFVSDDNNDPTIQVDIKYQREQFKSIYEKNNSVLEVRFYRKGETGQETRIMDERKGVKTRWFMEAPVDGLELWAKELCPAGVTGEQTLRVWFTVRHRDGDNSRNDRYGEAESKFSYACVEWKKQTKLQVSAEIKGHDEDGLGNPKQIAVNPKFDEDQFKNIKNDGNVVLLQLFVKKGKTRFQFGKDYELSQAKSSYSIPKAKICEEMGSYFDIFDLRNQNNAVQASCRISVNKKSKSGTYSRNFKYREFNCQESKKFWCD